MKKYTRLLIILSLLACLWAQLPAASAEGSSVVPIIQDDADLLTPEEEKALYEDMLPICAFGQPIFWTTLESGNYERVAEDFYFRKLGRGASGVLFTINMAARQLTVTSDGAANRVITRSESESITDNVFRMAGRGEYYECARSAFRQILQLLQGDQIARPMKIASNALLALVLALLLVYLYLRSRYETRPWTGNIKAALPVTAVTAAAFAAQTMNVNARMTKQRKTDLSSDSGSSGGGGFSGGGGGGGGGGGFSGSSGSHGF